MAAAAPAEDTDPDAATVAVKEDDGTLGVTLVMPGSGVTRTPPPKPRDGHR